MNPKQMATWLREFIEKNSTRLKDDQRLTMELIAKTLELQYQEITDLTNERR